MKSNNRKKALDRIPNTRYFSYYLVIHTDRFFYFSILQVRNINERDKFNTYIIQCQLPRPYIPQIYTLDLSMIVVDGQLGLVLLKLRSLISPLGTFSVLQKHVLEYSNHIHIRQKSPQLGCSDICQIWTWQSIGNQHFDHSEKLGK